MDDAQMALHAQMEERHWWFLGRRRIVQQLARRLLPADERRLIVDVGCGTGGNAASFVRDHDVVGIDTSPAAIDLARTRYPDVRFWCGALAEAPEQLDAGADLYLIMDVLEHVADDFLLLSTLLARCTKGAHVIVTVPAHADLWSGHDEALEHYRRYDPARLAAVWQGLPVTTRALSYFNARLYAVIKMGRRLANWRGRTHGDRGTDLSVPPQPLNRWLTSILADEDRLLVDLLEGRRQIGYRTGVSLLAVLRVENDGIELRTKPTGMPDHPNAPVEAGLLESRPRL